MNIDNDYAVELLGKDDTVPYYRQIYRFCSFDRWLQPDCVPGIKSLVGLTHTIRHQSDPYMVVIYGNGQYICVGSSVGGLDGEITDIHPFRAIVERHFAERGTKYLTDQVC